MELLGVAGEREMLQNAILVAEEKLPGEGGREERVPEEGRVYFLKNKIHHFVSQSVI